MLDVFLNSIKASWVNGVGTLWKKVGPFGIKLLVGNMGLKKGGVWCGALEGK